MTAAPLMAGDGPHGRAGHRLDDNFIAAPLSHGSNPNSNAAGRRREDDESLVASARRRGPGGTGQGHNTNYVTAPIGTLREHVRPGSNTDHSVIVENAVRRLTPTECCRLQGFPDTWLGPPNEPPDSPRYAALGDAVTVNVAEWIGRRILEAEQMRRAA